jgi:hypothetical protein
MREGHTSFRQRERSGSARPRLMLSRCVSLRTDHSLLSRLRPAEHEARVDSLHISGGAMAADEQKVGTDGGSPAAATLNRGTSIFLTPVFPDSSGAHVLVCSRLACSSTDSSCAGAHPPAGGETPLCSLLELDGFNVLLGASCAALFETPVRGVCADPASAPRLWLDRQLRTRLRGRARTGCPPRGRRLTGARRSATPRRAACSFRSGWPAAGHPRVHHHPGGQAGPAGPV